MDYGNRFLRILLSHPLTWAAVATVAGLEWAFAAWFEPSLTMTLAALGLGVLSVLAWPLFFARSKSYASRMYRLPDQLKAEQEEKLKMLKSDFDHLQFDQGNLQLRLLREKIENLEEVLKRRMNAGELTFGRYLGMAEQVYLSALDNLNEVAVALRSVSTIDPQYIERRLAEIRDSRPSSDDDRRESDALEKRGALFQQQRQRVAKLIAQNESALTVLDKTAAALAETRMEKGQASMDAEAAMAELESLAKRAGKYATTR